MDPKIIAEVWQAYSTLSDAQEHMQVPMGRVPFVDWPGNPLERANDRINHAKRHLQGFIEWAERNYPEAFVQAIQSSITCTLEGVETHDGGTGE